VQICRVAHLCGDISRCARRLQSVHDRTRRQAWRTAHIRRHWQQGARKPRQWGNKLSGPVSSVGCFVVVGPCWSLLESICMLVPYCRHRGSPRIDVSDLLLSMSLTCPPIRVLWILFYGSTAPLRVSTWWGLCNGNARKCMLEPE